MKRVVVTGMGVISPIGNDIDTFWESVKEQKTNFKPISYFNTDEYKVKLAAQVEDFQAEKYMDAKAARRMEAFCQYAVAASAQAIQNSGLDMEKEDLTRIGVSVGSGIGSLQSIEREHQKLLEKGPKRTATLLVPLMISNMAAGNVAIAFGLKGKCTNIVTACATGTHSIGDACRYIQCNEADVMVAGGTEAAITPLGIAGFSALTALSTETNPERASIPFDKERSGFVMGEGAGVVVLESYEHAVARGATILAEIVGYGATCDAFHITSPSEDGEGAARAMLLAINEAGIKPEEVDYINAHGTSTHHNDLFETLSIKKAFGDYAYKLKISSTKSMTGHLLGAAGAVEFITCVKSVMEDYIHPTVGYQIPDEDLDLDYTKEPVTDKTITYALSNSMGFGGHNGSLLVKKFVG
ncbi:3-oxoacyl-[acyl-carrier-protein] synthase 2 [Anaerocolumna cellulosilytica]|uniref:3-oxoacyl-[acyl-carrier-protein] synthase 2 n=1 Tax=Anaerocolumna cellulosilytica TaxID=433286 RepID=A0A6S6QZM5_9FIRM|nr:beta-ketoacyl-ACP synthase II [Anaerocolumna cellulosilytica]MBB5195049.1 3-oxoacyl-[acyl-carrier-protein] synthase II [Anaerocolumna cellulosilytica]BCJ96114.1 3-oxoacyl-[acyl-carrier-protein] synthase 2 [Anaerocolumna cellulosilytica]